ncbi:hypothetical protein THERMOT_666, partial [Bathymodiolus thermophilus thioautotrophic gill symbiont]
MTRKTVDIYQQIKHLIKSDRVQYLDIESHYPIEL